MSNNNSTNTNKPPFFNLIETATTVVQKQTEKECQPYFIDLSKLSQSETQALQSIGLIQKEKAEQKKELDNEGEEKEKTIPQVQLLRDKHRLYLRQVWKQSLKSQFVSLDSSRPWILYWCLQGYDLMSCSSNNSNGNATNQKCWISSEESSKMVTTLEDCWQGYYVTDDDALFPDVITLVAEDKDRKDDDELFFAVHEDDENRSGSAHSTTTTKLERKLKINPNTQPRYYCGGFGGGPNQMAHAATTYAAILCLCILATDNGDEYDDNDDDDTEENVEKADNENDDDYSNLHYSRRARQMLQEIRLPLYRWMCSLQVTASSAAGGGNSSEGSSSAQPAHESGYRMHHDGEIDVRATYTIACCAHLLGFLQQQNTNKNTVLGRRQVVEYVISCQTYEGGMGGEPYSEAHGGYTYCGIAAYQLLTMNSSGATDSGADDDTGATTNVTASTEFNNDDTHHPTTMLNLSALCGWLARRQTSYEGGFSGRTNKLVDGCYSFWIGGAMAIVSSMMMDADEINSNSESESDNDPWLTRYYQQQQQQQNQRRDTNNNNMMDENDKHNVHNTDTTTTTTSLAFPLLYNVHMLERYILLCAQEPTGGLRDKPSKPRDFYHTNYNLCGLSIAQHNSNTSNNSDEIDNDETFVDTTFGDDTQTSLESTHPLYNMRIDRVAKILNIQWD